MSFTSTSILLSWDEPDPEYQNGVITYYTINVTTVNSGTVQQFQTTTTNLTVSNLKPFTEYHCVVAAATSIGQGPFSAVFSIITPQAGKFETMYT